MRVYLSENPMFPPDIFRNVIRVPRELFSRLWKYLCAYDPTMWKTRIRGLGTQEIRSEVKVLVAPRLLVTGRSLQDLHGGVQMGKETIRLYCRLFCR